MIRIFRLVAITHARRKFVEANRTIAVAAAQSVVLLSEVCIDIEMRALDFSERIALSFAHLESVRSCVIFTIGLEKN